MPETQLQLWQRRVDEAFPDGLLASWDDSGGPQFTYPVPRVEVTAMHGLDPDVVLVIPDWGKTITGVVVSYHEIQTEPCLVVRVIFDHSPHRSMLWSSGVGALKYQLVKQREKMIRLARERGGSSLLPPPDSQQAEVRT